MPKIPLRPPSRRTTQDVNKGLNRVHRNATNINRYTVPVAMNHTLG